MMINTILQFDRFLTQFINGLIPHNHFFNLFFSFFSLRASSLPIWIVIIILLMIFEEKINKKFILYFFVALLITSVVVLGLKNITKRQRPFVTEKALITKNIIANNMHCDKDYSFPSGHASIAFASATVLATFDKKRKWVYYGIAVLIALSRIYLQCHYFLDVLTGGTFGFFIGLIPRMENSRPSTQTRADNHNGQV